MAGPVLPRVHLLLICDDIEERWEGDSLHDLLGVRIQLTAPMFPHICPQLCVYAQVTAHERTAVCRVLVIRAENDETIAWTAEEEVPFLGRETSFPFDSGLPIVSFPRQGYTTSRSSSMANCVPNAPSKCSIVRERPMAESHKPRPQSRGYSFRCKAIKPPPGTKSLARLPRDGEDEVVPGRRRLLLAGLMIAVLAVGVAIGRFLLP